MKTHYLKKGLFLTLFLLLTNGVAKTVTGIESKYDALAMVDECEQPVNIIVTYENGMPTAEISWEGEQPQNGWVLLFSSEGGVDINGYLSDPEGYQDPEGNIERVYSSPHTIYTNMLQEGPNEIYIVADCGAGVLIASENAVFEIQRGEEIVDPECETPYNVSGVQNDPYSMDISWDPQDGELYQIAWGPNGMEMNEEFFDVNETGSVIVSANPYHLVFPYEDTFGVFIRKFCGENNFSEWTVPDCIPPSGLQSTVTEIDVQLSWEPANALESVWHVAYGEEGFNPDDQGTIEHAYNDPSLTIPLGELEQGIIYEFYVRTDCFSNNFSPWAGPGSFSTVFTPCDPVENTTYSHLTHQSVDVEWTAVSNENQWEVVYGVAPLDEATAITIATNDSETAITGLDADTTYELYVTSLCESGETAQGELISFTTLESDGIYCIPYIMTGCNNSSEIDNFIVSGENDTSIYDINTGCSDSNYENKTEMAVDLAPGNQYFARISSGNYGVNGNQMAMWIDFNDDGTFDESERVGESSLQTIGFTNVNFTIPEAANPGTHRLRVMVGFTSYAQNLSPCNEGDSITSNGEVHDYTVNILSLENCDTVAAGTTTDDFLICSGEDLTITTIGASAPAVGMERKWQSSPAGNNNWTDVENGLLPTTTIYGGIQEDTEFRYVVTCTLSGETAISNTLLVTMSGLCYCRPYVNCIGGSLGGKQINNVSLIGETIVLDNDSGGCVGDGYSDYTIKFAPDLIQGETYSISITANNVNLAEDRIKAWIDFNDNTVFDETDVETIIDFPQGFPDNTVSAEFTVPYSAAPGIYRMRVRLAANYYGAPDVTGCNSQPFGGETEDYLIEVLQGVLPDCPQPTDIAIVPEDIPTSATISWVPGGEETQWELAVGQSGFDPDANPPIPVNGNPNFLITDLEPETDYDVYVKAVCEYNSSEWSASATFTTGSLSLENISFNNFSYFPNPVDKKLNLKAQFPIEEVIIFNISGQKLKSFSPLINQVELDVSQLASGLYFMKVSLNNEHKTIKLIKK